MYDTFMHTNIHIYMHTIINYMRATPCMDTYMTYTYIHANKSHSPLSHRPQTIIMAK